MSLPERVIDAPSSTTPGAPAPRPKSSVQRRVGIGLSVAMIVVIGVLTLQAQPADEWLPIRHTCLVCGKLGVADVIANVLLFTPLGVGLVLAGVPWRRALVVGAAYSTAIELTQYLAVPGRFATVSDVLTNTLGTGVGVTLAVWWRELVWPSARSALRLAIAGAVAWTGVLVFGAWGVGRVTDPRDEPASRSPLVTAPGLGWYAGTVREVAIGGQVIRHAGTGPVVLQARVGREVSADVVAQGRDPRSTLIPLLFVHAPGDTAARLLIGMRGGAALFSAGSRAGRARLRGPAVTLPGAFAATAPDAADPSPFVLRGRVHGDSLVLTYEHGPVRRTNALRLAPTLGWALISPFPAVDGPLSGLATAAWLVCLALPVGYFSRRATGTGGARMAWGPALGVVGALCLVPRLGSFGPPTPTEWGTSVAGLAAGAALADLLRPARQRASINRTRPSASS